MNSHPRARWKCLCSRDRPSGTDEIHAGFRLGLWSWSCRHLVVCLRHRLHHPRLRQDSPVLIHRHTPLPGEGLRTDRQMGRAAMVSSSRTLSAARERVTNGRRTGPRGQCPIDQWARRRPSAKFGKTPSIFYVVDKLKKSNISMGWFV